jgi:hypothetical protein
VGSSLSASLALLLEHLYQGHTLFLQTSQPALPPYCKTTKINCFIEKRKEEMVVRLATKHRALPEL